ncbi:MAG: hypothetical protein ABFC88_12825 [Thermoguttaceae bacterium]
MSLLYFDGFETYGDGSDIAYNVPEGTTWRGAWEEETTYVVNDVVLLSDVFYVALRGVTGVQPPSNPGNGFLDMSIGCAPESGSCSYASGEFTQSGIGNDLWDSDVFNFAYKDATGNVTLIARLVSTTAVDDYTVAGLMLRDNMTPGSPHVTITVSPAGALSMSWRDSQGGWANGNYEADVEFPIWLRLRRNGDDYYGAYSPDGVEWTDCTAEITFSMSSTLKGGLAFSPDDLSTSYEAVYSNVSLDSTPITGVTLACWATANVDVLEGVMSPRNAWAGRWLTTTANPPMIAEATAGLCGRFTHGCSGRTPKLTEDHTLIVGCRLRAVDFHDGDVMLRLWDVTNDENGREGIGLAYGAGGDLKIVRKYYNKDTSEDTDILVAATSGLNWLESEWKHVELKVHTATISFNGSLYNGSNVIDAIESTEGLAVGQEINAWYLPALTYIASIVDAHSITVTNNATHNQVGAYIFALGGSYTLRVNGEVVLSSDIYPVEGVSWTVLYDALSIESPAEGATLYLDDLYICDSTGSAPTNDFLGLALVTRCVPNSDSDTNEWTPQTGANHFEMVDDGVTADDDTYIEADSTGDTELWSHTAIGDVGTIFGVQVCTDVSAPAGSCLLKTAVRHSSDDISVDDGVTVYTSDYQPVVRLLEHLPGETPTEWTQGNFNATRFGVVLG